MRLPLLALILLVSGCAAPSPSQAPAAEAPHDPVPLKLAPCDTIRMIFTVPASAASALLPPQFEVVLTGNDQVEVIFGGVACQGDGMRRAFLEIAAQPRNASWRDPNVTRHYFEPEVDAQPGDGAARALETVGALTGNATVAVTEGGMTVKASNFTHALTLTASPGAPGGADLAPGISREWSAARGGFAFFDSAYGGGAMRVGVATLAAGAGTPTAKLLGESQQGPAIELVGTTFAGARAGFQPDPLGR